MSTDLDASSVRAYLDAHPDFLSDYAQSPQPASFEAFKQRKLEQANVDLRAELDDLIREGKRNQASVELSFQLALDALDAAPGEARIASIVSALHDQFKIDAVRILLLGEGQSAVAGVEFVPANSARAASLQAMLEGEMPFVGRPLDERRELLFGAAASSLESCAFTRLSEHAAFGVLAFGAQDPARFHPGTGGFLLERLGLLIGRLLRTST